jgi:hypothetical protein
MLFRAPDLQAIIEGKRTIAFRRWKRPTVKAGGTIKTAMGILAIDNVELIDPSILTDADAQAAGFKDLTALSKMFAASAGEHYRISLHPAGPDPRVELRARDEISPAERAEISARLARLDQASRTGPWTGAALRLIAEHPGRVAGDLAALAGMERAAFKANVRKLKDMGLTISLEIGYQLSPRGAAYLGSP